VGFFVIFEFHSIHSKSFMKFNKYLWELYSSSDAGIKQVNYWSNYSKNTAQELEISVDNELLEQLKAFRLHKYIKEDRINWFQLAFDFFAEKKFIKENAKQIYRNWIEEGIVIP
jgi:hypothetical protein